MAGLLFLSGCSLLEKRSQESGEQKLGSEMNEAAPDPTTLRHRLLVLPFLDEKPGRSVRVSEEARRTVLRELAKTGQFVMVSPEDFPQDIKKFVTAENEYDLEKLSVVAAGMGIAAVLEGKVYDVRVKRIGDEVGLFRQSKAMVDAEVRLRIYAGKTGREIFNDIRRASAESSSTKMAAQGVTGTQLADDPELVRQAVQKAVSGAVVGIVRAVEKLSWEGRVAMVSGERIYVNAGRLSGIQIGDILKVTEEGDEVFDPETGRFIGKAPGRMKGTIEVNSYFGKDGAIGVIHSGSGFKENDRVELY